MGVNDTVWCDHLIHYAAKMALYEPGVTSDGTNFSGNVTNFTADANQHNFPQYSDTMEDVKFYLKGVVNPSLCVFGFIGNVLNVIVLTRRRMKNTMECSMERVAQTGLIALAISDMLYCTVTFFGGLLTRQQTIFKERSLWLYINLLEKGFQNIFMNTSTWLTVIMAAGRYAAICRPLQARYLVGVNATRISIAVTFIFWTLVNLPQFFELSVYRQECPEQDEIKTLYILDQGAFPRNVTLKTVFTFIWFILGFLVPVHILAYCNVHLIKALRESSKMRRLYRVHQNKSPDYGSRITPTLVAIVFGFLILISPSEVLHFYYYIVEADSVEAFNMGIIITNVLQTINFACNFILYCIVNVHFRETWKEMMYCKWRKRRNKHASFKWRTGSSNSVKGTYLTSSVETNI